MDYKTLLAEALETIEGLPHDSSFETRELFKLAEWNSLSPNDRRAFGRHFSNEYNDGRIPGIEKLPIAKDRHTRYRKF